MSPWHTKPTVQELNALAERDMASALGLEYIEVGDDYLRARLPVDARTQQPYGLLHGGVSCVVSESLGSVASNLCVDGTTHYCVGIEISASHLRSATRGYVYAETRPLRVGRRIQVWETRLTDADDKPICISRLTTAVLER